MAVHVHGVVLPGGREHDVFIDHGCFTFAPVDGATTLLRRGYLVPGLVDAHAHLGLYSPAGDAAAEDDRARASAAQNLAAGVLALREPGGPNRASKGIGPDQGLPRTYTAGRFLAGAGRYFPGLAREVREEELEQAAEEGARHSGAWAKVIGDWPDADGRMRPTFGADALARAAARVHAAGGRIAMHATAAETIDAAIAAGFDSIEHAVGLAPSHLTAMAAQGIALVPTLMTLVHLAANPGMLAGMGLGPEGVADALAAFARQPGMVRAAVEAGVPVLAGTDAGMGPHGLVREEVRHLLAAGLAPEAALAAASWSARAFLGLPSIDEGAPADLVVYPEDPRGAPDVLARPTLVVLAGRVITPTSQQG